ncbi:MAG TPA: class I SAM-dependent methyltransferase [Chloroflexota bacterium]
MDAEQYQIMFEVERAHWWYRGIRRTMRALFRRYLAPGRAYRVLDAGCGTGGTTIDLADLGEVTGLDFSAEALTYAQTRGLSRLVRGSIEQLPFPDATVDVWTSFDVLYHRAVQDENVAFAEARRVLKPGGIAFFREPAFDWLRGAHDIGIHTERRFTVDELAGEAAAAGFRIEHATYANALLFPLALLKRSIDRFLPAAPADLSIPPAPLNLLMEAVLSLEAPLVGRSRLPVGLSVLVAARA